MIEVHPVASDDELVQWSARRAHSFGFGERSIDEHAARVRAANLTDRVLVACAGGEVLGGLIVLPFGQFWGGRPVPMGGIGSVVVGPEHRGRGVGAALMRAACDAMRARGEAISALGPATMPVYRAAGWETAGDQRVQAVPTSELAALGDHGLRERRATNDDHDAIKRVYVRAAAHRNGMIARPAFVWNDRLTGSADRYVYVVERDGAVTGYLIYSEQRQATWGYRLLVEDLAALDWPSEATLWRHVGAHRAQVDDAILRTPTDLLSLHVREQRFRDVWWMHWMLRLVDAPAAIRARGYSPAVQAVVPLTIADPLVGANDRDWVLRVEEGRGTLEPATQPGVAITASGLAALYSGFRSAHQLRAADLLRDATAEQLDALDACFAGPRAVYNDDF